MAVSKERCIEIYNYYKKNGLSKTCLEYGLAESTVKARVADGRRYTGEPLEHKMNSDTGKSNKTDEDFLTEVYEKNARVIEARIAGVETVEDLIDYHGIDLDKWKITKKVVNFWGNFDNPNRQIKIWLAPIEETEEEKELDHWIELFKQRTEKYKHPVIKIEYPKESEKEKVMLEVGPVDHHLGQLSWGNETGHGNYDIKISRKLYLDAVKYLLSKSTEYHLEKILYIIGSDFFNVNSQLNTTVRGTPQDEDCRWQKSFDWGVDLFVETIEFLKQFAPVHIKQVPGNHDEERIYYAGAFLRAWYKDDPNVEIDNEPKKRKYFKYGKNLLGFCHGDGVRKMDRLINLMPLEVKKEWAETENREWHCGHVHHETKKILILDTEENGVKVRTLSSLVMPDAWHASRGFISDRQSQGFIWHKEKGNIAEFKYRP
jgi:hypothetical protein